VPVFELIGGPQRDRVKCYANHWFFGAETPEQYADAARHAIALGFRALKWDPFGTVWLEMDRRERRRTIAIVEAVRAAVGPDIELMLDVHGRLNVPTAIGMCHELARFDLAWIEEPTPPESIDALADVRAKSRVPIAAGERWYEPERFLEAIEHRANRSTLETYVVRAQERRAPRGQERLNWMLFTNRPVHSYADAIAVIESYCHRWRIEDFHRTWKRGHCHVEETQLRKRDHVVRWATMLAAVAMRVERLKHLARTKPNEPATIGLTPIEVEALRAAKRTRFSKRTESIGDEMPTIETAVLWIAQFGGFAGKPTATPGSVTIGRGLERLLVYAEGFALGAKMARKPG